MDKNNSINEEEEYNEEKGSKKSISRNQSGISTRSEEKILPKLNLSRNESGISSQSNENLEKKQSYINNVNESEMKTKPPPSSRQISGISAISDEKKDSRPVTFRRLSENAPADGLSQVSGISSGSNDKKPRGSFVKQASGISNISDNKPPTGLSKQVSGISSGSDNKEKTSLLGFITRQVSGISSQDKQPPGSIARQASGISTKSDVPPPAITSRQLSGLSNRSGGRPGSLNRQSSNISSGSEKGKLNRQGSKLSSDNTPVISRQISTNAITIGGDPTKKPKVVRQVSKIAGVEIEMSAARDVKVVSRTANMEDDEISEDTIVSELEEDVSEGKHRNFEFTSNYSMMRILRLIVFLQVIAIMIDHPSTNFPPLFNVICRPMLYYAVHFYSKPFIDVVYLIQFFILTGISWAREYMPRGRYGISTEIPLVRHLQTVSASYPEYHFKIDFLGPRAWSSITQMSHYWMGIGFAIMGVLFLLKLWEILDYTDRKVVRAWIKDYIADGWYLRGGLRIAYSTLIGCVVVSCLAAAIYAMTKQHATEFPGDIIIGTYIAIIPVVVVAIWLIGVYFIKAAEASFIRYVSQNVNYTSTIILKRVIKAKLEVAILTMFFLFMPVLYNLIRALIVVTDWNDTLASNLRLDRNFFVPCYFDAFRPYRGNTGQEGTCPRRNTIASFQPGIPGGYYDDKNVLDCDSLLGILLYVVSCVALLVILCLYTWVFFRLIDLSIQELCNSRWVDPLITLYDKYLAEKAQYEADFTWWRRLIVSFRVEIRNQRKMVEEVLYNILKFFIQFLALFLKIALLPVKIVIYPILYFGKRAIFFICNVDLGVIKRSKSQARIKTIDENAMVLVEFLSSVTYTVANFLNRWRKIAVRYLNRTKFVTAIRVNTFKFTKSVYNLFVYGVETRPTTAEELAAKIEAQRKGQGLKPIAVGEWREDLKITARDRNVRRIWIKTCQEMEGIKVEFVSDHVLSISIFDFTIDSAGPFMLVCQYTWKKLSFTKLLVAELILYAFMGAILNYYFSWYTKAYLFAAVNVFTIFLTYCIKPYHTVTDRWIDWTGRVMIISIALALIHFDQHAEEDVKEIGRNSDGTTSVYKTVEEIALILIEDTVGTDRFICLDILMVIYIFLYILVILNCVGAFNSLKRKINNLRYAMHDAIVDFLIRKIDERSFAVENVHIGLPMLQQWDDVIKDQRRYGLIPMPDIRPKGLITLKEKLIDIKWASAFNLTIMNMKTSLGLTLLHIAMCSADSEVTRWLIHYYPQMLAIEDFQRDTPVGIALKELSYYLILYSKLNDGLLDDGTSYSDDDIVIYYPEITELRDAVYKHGEYNPDFIDVTILDTNQRDHLMQYGYFIEHEETKKGAFIPRRQSVTPSPTKSTMNSPEKSMMSSSMVSADQQTQSKSTFFPSPAKSKRKQSVESVGANVVDVFRYPEDGFHDDYEGGLAAGWVMLKIDVPLNNVDDENWKKNYKFQDFDSEEDDDLQYAVDTGIPDTIAKLKDDMKPVPKADSVLRGSLTNLAKEQAEQDADDIINGKKQVTSMSKLTSIFHKVSITNGAHALTEKSHLLQSKEEFATYVKWKLCKFASILLSDQIFHYCHNMKWNTTAYKELNKLSSAVQGFVAQNLAICFNLNPPVGFARLSEWSFGQMENIRESYNEQDAAEGENATDAKKKRTMAAVGRMLANGVTKSMDILWKANRGKALGNDDVFNDRVIQYMAESYAASRDVADLTDSDLSVPARIAWRAIARAFRKKTCTFVVPSVFTSPKPIALLKICLQRNELDCGDAILLSDIIFYQQSLIYVDCSFNRIGSRGMMKLCQSMKDHKSISTFKIDYNRIGPACGKAVGNWLKSTKTLQIVSMSHNRMGPLVRYSSSTCRETIPSAGRYIFFGIKANRTLHTLDLSYNNLGDCLAEIVPVSIMRHPTLYSLNLSGNNIGNRLGAGMIWAIGGKPAAAHTLSTVSTPDASQAGESHAGGHPDTSRSVTSTPTQSTRRGKRKKPKATRLVELCLADNQFGPDVGRALKNLLTRSSTLTALDVSGNYLGIVGGGYVAKGLDEIWGYTESVLLDKMKMSKGKNPTEAEVNAIAASRYMLKHDKKRESKLIYLNLSRTGLGPANVSLIMNALSMPECSLTSLDISGNPIGLSSENGGNAAETGKVIRAALSKNKTLRKVDFSRIAFEPPQILPIFGGISNSLTITKLTMNDMLIDEPCCLQLSTAIEACPAIEDIEIKNANMGPKGGGLICVNIERVHHRIKYIDFTGSRMGFYAIQPVVTALQSPACVLHTLHLANSDLDEEGGLNIVRALRVNRTLTDLDLSNNYLTANVAAALADVMKLVVVDGIVSTCCELKVVKLNDNPGIGGKGARMLIQAFANEWTEHLELSNISAGPTSGSFLSNALRKVTVAWKYLDISRNYLSRVGLNQVFWSLRQNRRLRVLKLGDNKSGSKMGTDEDTLGTHGIGMVRAIKENLIVRHIDFSYCGLSDNAGCNLFNALAQNCSIRKLSVRGNLFSDNSCGALQNMLEDNDVITEIDIGDNKRFGSGLANTIAEALMINHSITTLIADQVNLACAGAATLSDITEALIYNCSLRNINFDGNGIAYDWGMKFAEILSKNTTIVRLSIRNNRLDSRCGRAIYNSYKHNKNIEEIAVSSEEVGQDVFESFQVLYNSRRTVEVFTDIEHETLFTPHSYNVEGKLYI